MLHASGRAFRLQELVVRIGALLACSLSRVRQVRSRIQCNLDMVPSAHRQGNDAQGVTGTVSFPDNGLTERLTNAAKKLHVTVFDHLVPLGIRPT